jgi:hypothetical protein
LSQLGRFLTTTRVVMFPQQAIFPPHTPLGWFA